MSTQGNKLISRGGATVPECQTFQAKLRAAVYDGVKEADVKSIVQGLVEKAKAGDAKAIEMLFKHVLGPERAPTQAVQNNYYAGAPPAKATKQQPGSSAKLKVLRERVEAGEELNHPEDGPDDE